MSSFTNSLSTTIGKMRLEMGDTVYEDGILPGGVNFSDEELEYFYEDEGDDFWPAVARAFDAAAARWGQYPTQVRLGPESQTISTADFFTRKAQDARSKNRRPVSIVLTKVDYGMEQD